MIRAGRLALAAATGLVLAGGCRAPASRPPAIADGPLLRRVACPDLPDTGKTFGGAWTDLDGDGVPDLFLSRHGFAPELYAVRAGPRLVRLRGAPSLPTGLHDEHGAAACDFDGDGRGDLYVTEGADRGHGLGLNRLWRRASPDSFHDATPPGHLLNDPHGRGRGALWVALDDDRWPELLVLNFASPPRLFRFDGHAWCDWSERVALARAGGERAARAGASPWLGTAAAGDLDGDGRTDLVVGGVAYAILLDGPDGRLRDVTFAAGLPHGLPQWGHVALGDLDGDGALDLLLAEHDGRLRSWLNRSTPGRPVFLPGPDLAHLGAPQETRCVLLEDFDNDGLPDLYVARQTYDRHRPSNLIARGLGDGDFVPESGRWGGLPVGAGLAHGACALDLDRDGDLDLVLFHGDGEDGRWPGAVMVYENATAAPGLTVELAPEHGPPHGLGARLELCGRLRRLVRQVRSVATPWNSSILPAHFGVGDDCGPFTLTVTWPGGARQTVVLPEAGCAYLVSEGAARPQRLPGPR